MDGSRTATTGSMSTLYLGTDQETLAGKLAELLDTADQEGDFFTPTIVVVPSRYVGKWLRLWLARRRGVAINLKVQYLETTLADLLRSLDGRAHASPPEQLSDEELRLLILAILLDPDAGQPDLEPLRRYVSQQGPEPQRDFCRRAWQLSGRLSQLLRNYEYQRHDELIEPWLAGRESDPAAGAAQRALERSQRRLYELLVEPAAGAIQRLSDATQRTLRTLPQYAREVMGLERQQRTVPAAAQAIHLFGIAQVSVLHVRLLRWLGERFDLRLYHLNPLVGRLDELPKAKAKARAALQGLAQRFGDAGIEATAARGDSLLRAWGRAGAESLGIFAELLEGRKAFNVERLHGAAAPPRPTVLGRLQAQLLHPDAPVASLPQDWSLQLAACPGIYREVETVHHSIVANLERDPSLRQTDVAVLVTDMPRYRPVLQAVFDRPPGRLTYNLADFSAAGLSAFGHGVIGLLELAQESFTRARVFEVLLNPCFLARLGVEREQALVWLKWAETLGIHHSWDQSDKRERGYADSPLYSWRLGLQRLRLGRLLDSGEDDGQQPAPRYAGVIPFSDLASGDKTQLDGFCRAVEGLLPRLCELRTLVATGDEWARRLRGLLAAFLAVPADRPGEESVRERLLQALERLKVLDHLALTHRRRPHVPLALVREFIEESLEGVEGTKGEYLTGGVTIAALQPLRPIPFRILYLVGLGEGLFPGNDPPSSVDLRARRRCRGDVSLADSHRFLFLEAVLAAQEKLYLVYNQRDLQKDQVLEPCGLVSQLRRYLEAHVLAARFEPAIIPLAGSDPQYLNPPDPRGTSDVLVNDGEAERLLCLADLQRRGLLAPVGPAAAELAVRLQAARRTFALPANAPLPQREPVPTVTFAELRRFLRCPAEAGLKRHLHLWEDDEAETEENEPFYTVPPHDYRLVQRALGAFVAQAARAPVEQVLAAWPQEFADLCQEWRLRGRLPEGAFGEVDQALLTQRLRRRLTGSGGLARYLRDRAHAEFCGPLLVGDSPTPIGPRRRFPALSLALPGDTAARLVGSCPLVWRTAATLEILVLTNSEGKGGAGTELSRWLLEPLLFFLALRAGTPADANGIGSRQWLDGARLCVAIAFTGGITLFDYPADDLPAAESLAYLTQLTADFLDRTSFDLLPFDLIVKHKELQQAYRLPDGNEQLETIRSNFAALLAEVIEDDADEPRPEYRRMPLLEIATAAVPPDAFAKVRRRLHFLDRGPARAATS